MRAKELASRIVGRGWTLAHAAPVRPAFWSGIRAALATVVPFAVFGVSASGAAWASLAGYGVALADKGGAYRIRAMTLLPVACLGSVACWLGAVAGRHVLSALVATFVVVSAARLPRALGARVAALGTPIAVAFVVSLSVPSPSFAEAVERSTRFLAGGLWAALLSLVLFPVRIYRPLRRALAETLRALSSQSSALASGRAIASHAHVREALEQARATIAATRRGRASESGRGSRLLLLAEAADRIFETLVALEDVLASLAERKRVPNEGLFAVCDGLSETLASLAVAVEEEGPVAPLRPFPWNERLVALEHRVRDRGDAVAVEERHAVLLLGRLREYAEIGAELVESLYDQREVARAFEGNGPWHAPLRTRFRGLRARAAAFAHETRARLRALKHETWQRLRDDRSLDAIVLRHSLRVGLATTFAVALTHALAIEHGVWITLTVLVVLEPHGAETHERTFSRVIGTVLGSVFAALLGRVVHDSSAALLVVFVFSAASVAVMQIDYTLYAFFLTPTFVLLAGMRSNEEHLAAIRAIDTLAGGLLALAAARFVLPAKERARFPELVARAYDSERRVAALALGGSGNDRQLSEARREVGLAVNEAEASFQRVLAEASEPPDRLESWMALLVFLRRLAGSLLSIRSTAVEATSALDTATRDAVAHAVDDSLADVATIVREAAREPTGDPSRDSSREPTGDRSLSVAAPDPDEDVEIDVTLDDDDSLEALAQREVDPLVRSRLSRLAAQVVAARGAALRLVHA